MRFIKYMLFLSIAFFLMGTAQAKQMFYDVPFFNVEVKQASKIYVIYEFAAHTQTLFCTDQPTDVDAITSVEWVYKDTTRKLPLPVNLKDDAAFEGYFADPIGQLVITNEFGSSNYNGSIFVSCYYRNAKP